MHDDRLIYRRLRAWAALMSTAVALSGCYTVLQGPRLASSIDPEPYVAHPVDDPAADGVYGDAADAWLDGYADNDYDSYGYDYGTGYPVLGYESRYGLYGFGTPFAYGPGLGAAYPYGGYSPVYGPYGYGYDPYYTGVGSYVPPGYQLVTSDELAHLRAENEALRNGSLGDVVPTVNREAALRRRQEQAERAWTQRTVPDTRKSTASVRTPRPTTSTATATTTAAKPASSESKSSGSDAAKRRKTAR